MVKKNGALQDTPTHFVEKIWKSLPNEPIDENFKEVFTTDNFNGVAYKAQRPCIHSITKDTLKRWSAGTPIHFQISIPIRTILQFAPVKKTVSVQRIEIRWTDPDGWKLPEPNIYIDGTWFFDYDTLVKNEGFPSVGSFFKYHNKDFTGKIIHWTNLKY